MTGGKYDFPTSEEEEASGFKYNAEFETPGDATVANNNIKMENIPLSDDPEDDKDAGSYGGDDESVILREQWDKPVEFLMSCIAMSVGLGNFWRFPFVALKNGGGAFLIPYVIVLFFIGKPMYFLEMSMGQFCSKGQIKVWTMAPFFKGVGYGCTFGVTCVMSFYAALMAITVFYLGMSFQSTLPWTVCNEAWSEHNITCVNNTIIGSQKSISELYFKMDVMHEKSQIDQGIGSPDWRLTICLLITWLLILLILFKGVQSAGKVAYFTACFPYVVLIIFLIRGVTLEGATDGIWFFIKPRWGKLLEGDVWVAATTQCFFSLSVGFGPIIMYSSYNAFRHDVYKDAMVVSIMDTMTSFLAGVTIFSILGNLAFTLQKEVEDVVDGGPGLAFVSYPDAISKFDFAPQFFSVLFFLMLLTLGIGSGVSLANSLITLVYDQFPRWEKKFITIGVCTFGFFAGLIYITPGGLWLLDLVDYFGAGFIIYVMAILELVGMIYVYGLSNVVRDIEFMLLVEDRPRKLGIYWKACWLATPVVLTIVLLYSLITGEEKKYGKSSYPVSALVCGWVLVAIGLMQIPIFALHAIWKSDGDTFMEKVKESFKPMPNWGPARVIKFIRDPTGANMSFRSEWRNLKNKNSDSSQRRSTRPKLSIKNT